MTTVAKERLYSLLRSIIRTAFFVASVAGIIFLFGPRFGAVLETLTPPELPISANTTVPQRIDQGLTPTQSRRLHHESQGTRTLPMPLSWLMALEQPRSSVLTLLFGRTGLFMDDDYILRFGFINSEVSEYNPHDMPLGFAVTKKQNIPGISVVEDAVGFTCAACHTGQLTVGDQHLLIEGGAATIDLGLLTKSISAALGQTLVSSKIPVFNGRFDRFAKNVLQSEYSDAGVVRLKSELKSLAAHLKELPSEVDVVEGIGRLDALNRIGNQSFAIDYHRRENYVPPDAPVNYPHIWTASWFDWVQYDGSIMSPLVRNAGEALGVSAYINLSAPSGEGRFASSIDYKGLKWIENTIAGEPPISEDGSFNQFSGLLSPKWPTDLFGEIDSVKAARGEELYKKHCQICHLRSPVDNNFHKEFSKVSYYDEDGKENQSLDSMLRVRTVPTDVIGTDPAQADVLVSRRVNIAGDDRLSTENSGMGLDGNICVEIAGNNPAYASGETPVVAPMGVNSGGGSSALSYADLIYQYNDEKYQIVSRKRDSPNTPFAYALGALVQEANDRWFDEQATVTADERWRDYERGMPNCLRAGKGYKARPLDGVWATAPYLHNGSVATVFELLSPYEERSTLVQLGAVDFDPYKMGLIQQESVLKNAAKVFGHKESKKSENIESENKTNESDGKKSSPCIVDTETEISRYQSQGSPYVDGYFIVDTYIVGNCNSGHEFSNSFDTDKKLGEQKRGVIGPELPKDDRYAIIEFLKKL